MPRSTALGPSFRSRRPPSTSRSNTASGSPRQASSLRSAVSVIPSTTRSPKQRSACLRPKSSIGLDHVGHSTPSGPLTRSSECDSCSSGYGGYRLCLRQRLRRSRTARYHCMIAAKAEPIKLHVPLRRFRYDAKHDILPKRAFLRPARPYKHGRFFYSKASDCARCPLSAPRSRSALRWRTAPPCGTSRCETAAPQGSTLIRLIVWKKR